MDIIDKEWVVKINALLVRILLIIHFGNPRYGYFKINIRSGKVGDFLRRPFDSPELSV